jgi:hypothetical protein
MMNYPDGTRPPEGGPVVLLTGFGGQKRVAPGEVRSGGPRPGRLEQLRLLRSLPHGGRLDAGCRRLGRDLGSARGRAEGACRLGVWDGKSRLATYVYATTSDAADNPRRGWQP